MTDQTLPVCRLCKCVAADYKNPGEDVKHHCANDHCTLHMVLMTPEQWTALMGDQIQAIANKVCRDIPDRFTVCIVLEKDAGCVELWRGNHERFELDCDGGIEDQIENAMAVAMGEQQ